MTFYFPKSDFICTFILVIGAKISEIGQHYNSEILKFDSPALVHGRKLMVILLVVFLILFMDQRNVNTMEGRFN